MSTMTKEQIKEQGRAMFQPQDWYGSLATPNEAMQWLDSLIDSAWYGALEAMSLKFKNLPDGRKIGSGPEPTYYQVDVLGTLASLRSTHNASSH